jgi:hypothetical protein
MKRPPEEHIEDVFLYFGKAAYHAQCMEFELVTMRLLDSLHKKEIGTQQDFCDRESVWEKKTLGHFIRYLKKGPVVPADFSAFLDDVLEKRNFLIHDFFIHYADKFTTEEGRDAMLTELRAIGQLLETGHKVFEDTTRVFAKDFGVTSETIAKEPEKLGVKK